MITRRKLFALTSGLWIGSASVASGRQSNEDDRREYAERIDQIQKERGNIINQKYKSSGKGLKKKIGTGNATFRPTVEFEHGKPLRLRISVTDFTDFDIKILRKSGKNSRTYSISFDENEIEQRKSITEQKLSDLDQVVNNESVSAGGDE